MLSRVNNNDDNTSVFTGSDAYGALDEIAPAKLSVGTFVVLSSYVDPLQRKWRYIMNDVHSNRILVKEETREISNEGSIG